MNFRLLYPLASGLILLLCECFLSFLLSANLVTAEPRSDSKLAHSTSKSPEIVSGNVYSLTDPPEFDSIPWSVNTELREIASIRTGDFNADGLDDLLLYNSNLKILQLALSQTNHSFIVTAWAGLPTVELNESIAIGDLDHNGCDDLAIPGAKSSKWTFAFSNCKNSFDHQEIKIFNTPLTPTNSFALTRADKTCLDIVACSAGDDYRSCLTSECQGFYSYTEKTNHTLVGQFFSGNIRGDGNEYLLRQIIFQEDPKLYLNKDDPQISSNWLNMNMIWATFETNYKWEKGNVGDFNGDGRADIIVSSKSLLGTWLGVSIGKTAIEIPAKRAPFCNQQDKVCLVGDFYGDGAEDILVFDKSGGNSNSFNIFSWKKIASISGATIKIDDSIETLSDENGNFNFPRSKKSGTSSVLANKEGFSFMNNPRELHASRQQNAKVNFVAIPNNKSGAVGSNLGFTEIDSGPYICLGYNFSQNNVDSKWTRSPHADCPAGYAILANEAPQKSSKTSGSVHVLGTCCRLPIKDILTDEHYFTEDTCPPNYVVTGNSDDPDNQRDRLHMKMRCTKLNTNRYTLGPETTGIVFGTSLQRRHWANRIDRSDIPLAFRIGALRNGYNEWEVNGCIGQPWGSVLTAKTPGNCSNLKFRQIVYAGNEGDPPAGTPVQIFPECREIENIYDPRSGCF